MGWFSVRNWLFHAAAYLALAIMGMFTFVSLDAPYFNNLADKMTDKSACFSALIIHPVEYSATISTTKDHPFSPLRHGLFRLVMPVSVLTAGADLLCATVRLITKAAAYNKKNTILLKLRI